MSRIDPVEVVYLRLKDSLTKRKSLKFSIGEVCIIFRFATSNYAPTSFREFIIISKALGIIKEVAPETYLFLEDNFKKYLTTKEGFKL